MARRAKDEYERDYTVTEPRTNPKGYTEYKVTAKFVSKTNPEDIKEVVVWKRYSDLRKLHGDLAYTHRHLFRRLEDFPAFPKAQVFGRFEPEVIEERRQAAETMLRFTVPIPALTNSPQLKEFFRGGEVRRPLDACSQPSLPPPLIPMPPGGLDETQAATEQLEPQSPGAEETGAESYRLEGEDTGGDPGIREQQGDADLDSLFAGGGLEDEDGGSPPPGALPPHDLALFDPVLAGGAEEEAEAAAEALWELDPGPGAPVGGYVAQATAQVRQALAREAAGDVAGALSCYRGAVQVLLQGLPGPPMEEFPVGTCQAMCPPAERARRERQGQLHRLEEDGAVKEYSRPAAGKPRPLPEELRPPAVLLATVRHLLGRVESQAATAVAPAECYDFITDRLRAVRLDAALQGLRGVPYATLLERTAAYLLHAGYRLGARSPALWDPHLHRAQLQETFAGLRRCYREPGPHHAQPLFQACFLLCNLGSSEALRETLDLPASLRGSPELRTALDIHWAFLERDWACFFRRARGLSYLASCALYPHVAPARSQALLTLSHGFNSRRGHFPLERLARLLAADSKGEVAKLCKAHGLQVEGEAVIFQKAAYKNPGVLEHWPSWELVEGKRGEGSLLELVEGVCS